MLYLGAAELLTDLSPSLACLFRSKCHARHTFVPLWGIAVFLVYTMRRVNCRQCGVRVEAVPWATGKHHLTDTYAWFLATWARRLSRKEVAEVFHTSWQKVFRSVEMAVEWGRAHPCLDDIQAIGVDEIQWKRGYRFLTLVYQIDAGCRRLLWIGEHRRAKTLLRFFRWFGRDRSKALAFICSERQKSPSTIQLAIYLNPSSPTDSADEAIHFRSWLFSLTFRGVC